ncbi:MAG: DNA gyrase subunit A [Anaerolineae bacterium]|nr:DNA gyrase subunit A [Anaerolineae bacterium]MCO5187888.1 DNA gyrase subunit A [Anaerolineae bacterium]MCO5192646.1 DNA gyrase subunit A [Anaerolineae bacterium]
MRRSYLDYAMSVIVARALPDARDGLKPVHRRILYAMHDMGIRYNSSYRKSARIVGEVLGKYHPHGDSAVYDSMVRMAQDFSLRYMLVDGQGNFGSIDGDGAAAMRYTEARLSRFANELLEDLDKETVDFRDNFDGSEQEPVVLPGRLPNLLLNGSSGIAVGMATNIPPHNLTEVCDAIVHLIDNQHRSDDVTLDDLMAFVKGPDFPTGAEITGIEGIRNAYATGRGRVIMRAKMEIVEPSQKAQRDRILITEIPFQVNKANLIQSIAELVQRGVIPEIADLRDESGRSGLRIVIDLKRGTQPLKVRNLLFKHTQLQSTFGVQMLALVDNRPRLLSLKRALQVYIDHRVEVTTRRIQFELDKALRRQHVLEGLRIALNHLDAVIETIRQSDSADSARQELMSRFGLSEVQATAILDMQLRRLAALERQKIEEEYAEITERIAYFRDLLAHIDKILLIIRDEVLELREKYGDARRTEIKPGEGEINIEDMIQDEDVLISMTQRGYIKRTPLKEYRLQGRGGKGLIGMSTREEDILEHLQAAGSLSTILFFTDKGKVYTRKAYEIPEASRTARGTSVNNVLPLESEEKVTALLAVTGFGDAEYLMMATRKGRIKRVVTTAFDNVRQTGIIALSLEPDDELGWVKLTHGGEHLILVSEMGKGIRFDEEDVRPMGRTAAGVNAIKLADNDYVAGFGVVSSGEDLLIITERGYGKRTSVDDYRLQNRYGSGVRALVLREAGDRVVSARVVSRSDEVTCISSNGIMLRTSVASISRQGRNTRGVRVMDLNDDDVVASVAVVREGRFTKNGDEESAEPLDEGVVDSTVNDYADDDMDETDTPDMVSAEIEE